MSKLDEAINEAVKPKLKQNIKNLFLELVGEDRAEGDSYGMDYENLYKEELRKKVEKL